MPPEGQDQRRCHQIYRADGVNYSAAASKRLAELTGDGLRRPARVHCQGQYSFSDNAKSSPVPPPALPMEVREVRLAAGARGGHLRQHHRPCCGLPKKPLSKTDGITGLF